MTTELLEKIAPGAFASLEKRCFPNPWGEEAFNADAHRRYLSLWQGEYCLAYLAALVVAGEMELLRIAVHPAHRRKGFARKLLTELMSRAHKEGVDRLFLEVSSANAGAIAFYGAHGLTVTGRRCNYYGSGDDALVMSGALSPT